MDQPWDFLLDANCCNKCPFLFRISWVTCSPRLPNWCSRPPPPKPLSLGMKLIALLQERTQMFLDLGMSSERWFSSFQWGKFYMPGKWLWFTIPSYSLTVSRVFFSPNFNIFVYHKLRMPTAFVNNVLLAHNHTRHLWIVCDAFTQ